MPDPLIRPERPSDNPAIAALLREAFPSDAEARLVDALRRAGALTISLVAIEGETLCGHIAFSPVTLDGKPDGGIGLAPLAVSLAFQRRGIGAALIQAGLSACRGAGNRYCVVLGEPEYYRRFGFAAASRYALESIYNAGEAFMAQALTSDGLDGRSGLVRYHSAFDAL